MDKVIKTSEDQDFPVENTDVVYEPVPHARRPAIRIGIAEAFQEMLWQAFAAGYISRGGASLRQSFEVWYNKEVI